MLRELTGVRVYIAVDYIDLRMGIDGLTALVQQHFQMDPMSEDLYLFCGRRDKGTSVGRRRISASV